MPNAGLFTKYINIFRYLDPKYISALKREIEKIDGWLHDHQIALMWIIFSQLEGEAVEIGCWKGRATFAFMANIPRNQFSLHCVDTFLGSEEHKESLGGSSTRPEFEKNLKERGLLEQVNIIQKESVEAAEEFKDGSLDIVFIDAAHDYENVKLDILAWLPKLKPHGLMIGHDYPHPDDPNGGFKELFDCVNKYVKNSDSFYHFGYSAGLWGAKKSPFKFHLTK